MSASSDAAAHRTNPLGRIALVLGVLVVLAQATQAVFAELAPLIQVNLQLSARDLDARLFPALEIVIAVLAVLAVIAGAAGLTRRTRPRAAAAAGLALGAAAFAVLLASVIAQAAFRAAL